MKVTKAVTATESYERCSSHGHPSQKVQYIPQARCEMNTR